MNKSIKEYIEGYNAGHSEALKRIPLVKRLEREEIYKEILDKLPEEVEQDELHICTKECLPHHAHSAGFNECLSQIKSILTPPK